MQRIRKILFNLVVIAFAAYFIYDPSDDVYKFIVYVLATVMAVKGIRDIFFYFTMARHMVGGRLILFQGVIIFDFALFTASLSDVPKIYILMYLIGIHAFSGIIEILRSREAKRTVAGPWKLKFSHGIVNIALAIACLVFIRYSGTVIIIFGLGLIYSSTVRIISALRKTAFIVIQ